jgi:hypothetical protein
MIEDLNSLRIALRSLRHQRSDSIKRLTQDNTPENRAIFREIQQTISELQSIIHVEHGLIGRILKATHLLN